MLALTNFELKRLKPKLDIVKKPENRVHELTDSNVSPRVALVTLASRLITLVVSPCDVWFRPCIAGQPFTDNSEVLASRALQSHFSHFDFSRLAPRKKFQCFALFICKGISTRAACVLCNSACTGAAPEI